MPLPPHALRLARRLLFACLAVAALLYAGDALALRIRHPAAQTIQVTDLYTLPFKGGRTEYDFGGYETRSCVASLLPHAGQPPCWYLRGHATRILCCSR